METISLKKWINIIRTLESDMKLSEKNIINKIKRKILNINIDIYRLWKKENFNINYEFLIKESPLSRRYTILTSAIRIMKLNVIQILLDKGAYLDVNLLLRMLDFYIRYKLSILRRDTKRIFANIHATIKLLIAHTVKLKRDKPKILIHLLLKSKSDYWDLCTNEIEQMKKFKIYEFMTCSKHELAILLRNENIRNKIKKKFPEFSVYFHDLEYRFRMGINRLKAINTGETIVRHFENFRGIVGPFIPQIVNNLKDDEDLENLRKAGVKAISKKKI